ncbi:MAG: hypothetical protein ACRC4M_04205 [Mycoplasma sp.]
MVLFNLNSIDPSIIKKLQNYIINNLTEKEQAHFSLIKFKESGNFEIENDNLKKQIPALDILRKNADCSFPANTFWGEKYQYDFINNEISFVFFNDNEIKINKPKDFKKTISISIEDFTNKVINRNVCTTLPPELFNSFCQKLNPIIKKFPTKDIENFLSEFEVFNYFFYINPFSLISLKINEGLNNEEIMEIVKKQFELKEKWEAQLYQPKIIEIGWAEDSIHAEDSPWDIENLTSNDFQEIFKCLETNELKIGNQKINEYIDYARSELECSPYSQYMEQLEDNLEQLQEAFLPKVKNQKIHQIKISNTTISTTQEKRNAKRIYSNI